ncbi:MAG: hypothetical protein KDK05_07970 [Candidatus Competibacteraceae bacterium]|nr:hypothetical protein [Candidatus Competibacteraceae bacterium]
MDIDKLATMSEERICNLAFWAGYDIYDAPMNDALRAPGKRISGYFRNSGKDCWRAAANVRLWEIQKQRALPPLKRIMQMVGL